MPSKSGNSDARPWHALTADEALDHLASDRKLGLSEQEAARRLQEYGPNALPERGLRSPWWILAEQFTSLLIILLIVAAAVSAWLGETIDATAIVAIVVLNGALGFYQEYRAERAMAALRRLAAPYVRVRRDGHVREISASDVVPGDVVLLEAGSRVPADGRLVEVANLKLDEAALTGESVPVEKQIAPPDRQDVPLPDRHDMVYMGTVVTYGRAAALLTATGLQTELGHIAEMLQTVEREPTPLQRRLDQLGHILVVVVVAIVAGIFLIGLARGEDPELMFLTAVSLAVAAVPEGLPAIVTIALSLGAQRMLKRNALIRKLPAVETLGSVTVICSDKTGTLTENRMTVTVLDVAGRRVDVPRQGAPREVSRGDRSLLEASVLDGGPADNSLVLLLAGSALCNDAILESDSDQGLHVIGDPTEGALVMVAAELGLVKDDLDRTFPRVGEVPFDSVRKRMTTLHRLPDRAEGLPPAVAAPWAELLRPEAFPSSPASAADGRHIAFTKGAVDRLLAASTHVWHAGRAEPLDAAWSGRIDADHDRLAGEGLRVLGVAFRILDSVPEPLDESLEAGLIFVGLEGMRDPPRAAVPAAVEKCGAAGIRPVMITGDHALTAAHIASELGITSGDADTDDAPVTGVELDRLDDAALDRLVATRNVYARVAPAHKVRLVDALQRQGEIVAMTGDGVNDAPALKSADIGVAMGITGTDVAKDAADMVLRDDNFATIVAAVEEGRRIFDNIRRFLRYTMTSNAGEIWVMLIAPFLGMPLPLLPLQILWINLVTDGLPGLALGIEPAERNTMRRPPYPPGESVLGRGMARDILWLGLLMGLVSLGMGYGYFTGGHPLVYWRTMLFSTLTFAQMALSLSIRSERDSLLSIGLGTNPALLGAVGLTVALQLAVIYLPPLQTVFKTTALSPRDLALCVAASTVVFCADELRKAWKRREEGKGEG